MRILIILYTVCLLNQSCHSAENQLTEGQTQEIIKSATEVVKKVFEYSDNLEFEAGLNHYSETSNSYFITDGIIHSLADLENNYKNIGPYVEELHNTIESWNVKVLSQEVVMFTLPVKLKLKLKGRPEFEGQLVWTATLQKQEDRWMIVQSHESWLNCAEVSAVLKPTNDN